MTLLKFIKFIYLLIMVLTYYVAFIWCLKKFCILIYNSDKSHFRVSIGTDKYLQNPLFFFCLFVLQSLILAPVLEVGDKKIRWLRVKFQSVICVTG